MMFCFSCPAIQGRWWCFWWKPFHPLVEKDGNKILIIKDVGTLFCFFWRNAQGQWWWFWLKCFYFLEEKDSNKRLVFRDFGIMMFCFSCLNAQDWCLCFWRRKWKKDHKKLLVFRNVGMLLLCFSYLNTKDHQRCWDVVLLLLSSRSGLMVRKPLYLLKEKYFWCKKLLVFKNIGMLFCFSCQNTQSRWRLFWCERLFILKEKDCNKRLMFRDVGMMMFCFSYLNTQGGWWWF